MSMSEKGPPMRRRRLGAQGMVFRRRRVFSRLREGLTYDEIAAEEGVSSSRIRQIVSEELQKRAVDSGADHAKLQLDRLAPAVQLGAEAIAAGDISAISPYLRALDRLDRYQTVASANQAYDDEARKKLMEKINRMAENYGVDEVMWKAASEHLQKIGVIPPGEAEEQGAVSVALADPPGEHESESLAAADPEAAAGPGFFYPNWP
jgi:hypothetical protein